MQPLLTGRALQLQHHLAAIANVFFGDGDGVRSQTTLLSLLNAGHGIFEFELRQVFLLLRLHECPQVAQLFFNSARGSGCVGGKYVGRDSVGVGQGNNDLTAPNFEMCGTLSQAAVAE